MTTTSTVQYLQGPAGLIAAHVSGPAGAPVVVMSHSIFTASFMWEAQAAMLAARGLRVVCLDTRGHGASPAAPAPYAMSDLADDVVAALDGLQIERAHYVGLSLGGMSGFVLGIQHARRVLSLCLVSARADAPPAVAAPWDERVAIAQAHGSCAPLGVPTIERWFGRPWLDAHPPIAERYLQSIATTSVEAFVGCARAIQGLDCLEQVRRIGAPTTLVVGAHDGVLPDANRALRDRMPNAVLELVPEAGHMPNIDRPEAFDAALARHFDRVMNSTPGATA